MKLHKFKGISHDDKTYTIEHPSGKKLFIEKDKLDEKAHKEIKQLFADGGEVDSQPDYQYKTDTGDTEADKFLSSSMNQGVSGQESAPSDQGEAMQRLEQGKRAISPSAPVPQSPGTAPGKDIVQDPVEQVPNINMAPARNLASVAPKTGEQPIVQSKTELEKLNLQQQAQAKEAMGAEEKATENVAQAQEAIGTAQTAGMTPEQRVADFNAKDQVLSQAFQDKKIDPFRLYHNMNTGNKVANAIALIASGIGSGLTGQPNAALGVLNKALDEDVAAQKNDQTKAYTAWQMNREKLGTDIAADLATRNMHIVGAQSMLQAAQTRAILPDQKLRLQTAIAGLEQQRIQTNMQRSLIQGSMGGTSAGGGGGKGISGTDPSILVDQLVQDPEEKKTVLHEIKQRQNLSQNAGNILNAFDQATSEMSGFGGNVSAAWRGTPGQSKLKALLTPNMQNVDGTVRQGAMTSAEDTMIPSVKDLGSQERFSSKRDALIKWMRSEMSSPTSASKYMNLDNFSSTKVPSAIAPQQKISHAPPTQSKSGKKMIFKNGKYFYE